MDGSSKPEPRAAEPSTTRRQAAPSAVSAERKAQRTRALAIGGTLVVLFLVGLGLWLGTPSGGDFLGALGLGDASIGLLVLVVVLVIGFSVLIGLRDPIVARIGLRNVVRARTRTAILIVGLLVGSTIISSSLVIGDTVNNLTVHFTYIADGDVDEAVYEIAPPSAQGGASLPYAPFPISVYAAMNDSAPSLADVAGMAPMLLGTVSAFDLTQEVAQPDIDLVGVDAWESSVLGPFASTSGGTIDGPYAGGVLLNPTAASELSASVGDRISLSGTAATPINFTVLGIVAGDTRGGFQDDGTGNIFATLGDAQNLSGTPGALNYVGVANTGGLTGGPAHTHQVWPLLNASLGAALTSAGVGSAYSGLAVHSVLLSDLDSAEQSSQSLTQLFLVLGLFSIVAGCILIVGIFAMLAEERRGEMGVARAVGMRRGQLIRAYYFEGLAYSAGAALLGTLLGVVVGWAIIAGFASVVEGGDNAATQAIIESFTYTPQSLALAYAAGFLLTLGTVAVTCAYVSRMNIVRAIRSQPELVEKRRSQRIFFALGGLLLLVGALLAHAGEASGTDIDIGYLGVSFLILGAGLLAAARVPLRYALSASALGLLAFWGDYSLRKSLFPGTHSGGIPVFFQEGVWLILSAVILYVFNSDLLVRALAQVSRKGSKNLPVVRLAFSYPSQRRFRSAMTISIFAMVLFTITAIAAIGNGISSGVSTSIATESGGFQFYGTSSEPIQDLPGQVQNNSTLRGEVSTLVPFYTGGAYFTVDGKGPSFGYSLAAAPTGVPAWEDFYTANDYALSSTLDGMSPAQVWSALEQPNSTDAVVDGSFGGGGFGAFTGGSGHPPAAPGDNLTVAGPFAPVQLTVIAVMSQVTLPIILVNPELMVGHFGFSNQLFFLVDGSSSVPAQKVIQDFQTHFFAEGLQLIDFATLLSTTLQFTDAFINLLEVFVALGLVVGITSLGILALRAVVERRTQIGVVRAVGFRRRQVLGAFLTEYSFLALMGIGIGAVMGLVLAYNLNQSIGGFFSFAIPWENLAIVFLASYGLTLVATGIPSFRASRIPPAEAIRYTE